MMNRTMLPWAVLVVLALVGCSSTPVPRPLPLHAVFLPLVVEETPGDLPAEEASPLQLELQSDAVAAELVRGLQGSAFCLVTNLEAADASAETISQRAQDQLWQQEAAAAGADVLVRAKVFYERQITDSINDKFWLNLPLFLLGGPFCFFINDRSYKGRARLQAEFFDLTDLHDALDEDARLLEFPIIGEFASVDFDFVDRAGKGAPRYLLGLLVPAGLLARSTDTVGVRVESAAVELIVSDLLSKIGELRPEFLQNDLATFHILEDETVVERRGDGRVRVAFPIELNRGSSGLRDFVLSAGDTELMNGNLDDAPDSEGRIWVRGDELAVPAELQYVRLRVVDAVGGRRSYTFPIAPAQAPNG